MKPSLRSAVAKIPLVEGLMSLKGNARACLFLEPLWAIPYNLLFPLMTIYMYAMGVDDQGIGAIAAVGFFVQMASALFGGVLVDKFGRRRMVFIMDIITWVIPFFLWAFAQNFTWFLVAAVFNAGNQITNISFTCLLVEDTDKRKLVIVYTWIYIAGQLAVFFSPISSLLVGRYPMESVMRGLLIFAGCCMIVKAVTLYSFARETQMGRQRMEATKGVGIFKLLGQYGQVLRHVFQTPKTRFALCFMILSGIWIMCINNVFALYVTQTLGMAQALIPIFPMIKALIMLGMLFFVQKWLDRFPIRAVILMGIGLYLAAHAVLILAGLPALGQGMRGALVLGYVLLEALGYCLVLPRRDSIVVLCIEEERRTRINALINVLTVGIVAPFSYFVGWLSNINRQLSLGLNMLVFALCGILVLYSKKRFDEAEAASGEPDA